MSGFNECRKVAPQGHDVKDVFEPERWQVWPTTEGNFALQFQIPGGMELIFQIGRSAALPMAEALRTLQASPSEK